MLIDKECGIQLQSVDSTNDYAKKKEFPIGYWVLAETQTNGRGRDKKVWVSQGSENIFFSGKFQLPETNHSISLLSLFSGSAVLKSLIQNFPNLESSLSIKWPNDIYFKDKKVSGILIESEYIETNSIFIVGIGINLYGEEKLPTSDYLSTSPLGKNFKTNLVNSLIHFLNKIESILLSPDSIDTELDWIFEKSLLRNKTIETTQNNEKFSGNVFGYDRNGFLILKKEDGTLVSIIDTGPDFKVV